VAPVARRVAVVKNLGAAPVTLLLARADHSYAWGPFTLAPYENLRIDYCTAAGLTLELRSDLLKQPWTTPLTDLTQVVLNLDRWTQAPPRVSRAEDGAPAAACEGAPFRIGR
jgi:hypothetical protein